MLVGSLSSLVLLLPAHGHTIAGKGDPIVTYKPKPPKMVVIADTPLQPQTAAVSIPAAPVVSYTAPAINSAYSGTGDQYLDWIISRESGGNAFAVNPSSGACGIAQELPCGKSGCSLGDAACEINWMRNYCIQRYGSTYNAYLYWIAHGNY